ncbi:MAG: hypothetical protein L0Y36_06965 [Planctomycetales bacterium]|nr:hypothetical protein [Planctomycetales bacterium]
MWDIFETCWLLLTVAGIALVAAGIVRQARPGWGYKPLLIPLALGFLAFGLDMAVMTDYEAVVHIVASCKRATIQADAAIIMHFVSPHYTDSVHRDKQALSEAAEHILKKASVKKIRTQSHAITTKGTSATSELNVAVHLNPDSHYAAAGSLVFAGIHLEYEKIGRTWYICRIEVASINYTPMNWRDVW